MFNQRQRGSGNNPSGNQDNAQVMPRPLEIQVPDVHESMRLAGVQDVSLPSNSQKRVRLLCCCGSPGCGIGPMTQVEEV